MSVIKDKAQFVWGDLWFLPAYPGNPSLIPTLTVSNTVAETANINALARQPFAMLSELNYSIAFEDEEETRAINCGQELFLSKATKVASIGWVILQNNDLDSLNYLLGGDRLTNIVTAGVEVDEYMLQTLGTAIKPACAFRFVSCAYQVADTAFPWRRDIIYISDATIDGAIEDAYRVGTETFEGITFNMISRSKTFQKIVKKWLTEADVAL